MRTPPSFFQGAALIALLIILSSAATSAVVSVPGTKVSIEPPDGFVVATQFPGVQNAELVSSIMVTELPAPFEGIAADLTREGLLSRGMTLVSSANVNVAGRSGRLISATQIANGAVFEKWMAVFGTSSETVLVVATYPQTLASKLRAPMRSSVLSVMWNPDAKLDPFDGLTFRIQESEHLRIQNRMQNMLLLAHPARITGSRVAEPFAVVGSSYSPIRIDNIEIFAKQRIMQTAQISDLKNIRGEPGKVDGKPAYEITASAKDLNSGESLSVYQLIVLDGDTYYLMQGMVAESRFGDYLPEFRQVAQSLKILKIH